MLSGDPNKFAVLLKAVDQWNCDQTFYNGVLILFVDGYMFPNEEIIVTTLAVGIPSLKKSLSDIAVDNILFNMEKTSLFRQLYDRVYPNDINADNDYRFLITPDEICDKGFFIFAVSNETHIKFTGARLDHDETASEYEFNDPVIRETVVPKEYINRIISDLDRWQTVNKII